MKVSTAQEAINGNSNDTVITPLRLKQVLNTKEIGGGGGSTGNETDPIFKASPASKITQSNINAWNDKQNKLVSGQNIKTINGQNILGEGNIDIEEGTGGVIEETDPTVPDYVKAITEEDIARWNQNNDGEIEFDISSAVDTIFEGVLLGGESVVLENHKRFLDVYFVVSLTNHRMFSKYTIDTTLKEPSYGGTTFPSSDSSSGVSSYVSEGKWEASTNTFTHFRTGYFNIEENKFYERNDRETYYIYRIDTYDDPLLEIKLPDVNVDLDEISSKMSKVLYDNPTGANTTVNLSEPSANFKYLDIFFRDNDNTHSSVRVYEPDGKFVDLTTLANWSKMLYVKQARFQISGSKISPTSYSESALTSSPSTSIQTTTNMIYITKVVGYYDENVLIVGNNGTEIVNLNEPKNIITLKLDNTLTCVSGVYTHINLSLYNGQGDKLTCENGYVKVGKGITKVRVSGQAKFETGAEGAKHIHIDVNETTVAWNYGSCIEVGQNVDAIVTPFVLDVKEGDLIDLKYYANNKDKVSGHNTCYTFLTVEAVEDNKIITVNSTIDGIPIGSEFEYDGEEVPDGYEEVIEEVVEPKDPTCYYDGDTYVIPANAYINVGGCITASKSQIRFGIFVYKSLKNIKSITVNYAKLTIRYPDGGYIISEVDVTNYLTPSNEGENVIYFEYRPSSAMSPTNNTPVSVEINGLNLTFNE